VSRPIEEFKRTLESVAAIANAQLTGDPATVVTGISLSSNNVQEGDLFQEKRLMALNLQQKQSHVVLPRY